MLLDGFLAGIEPMWSQFWADPRSWVFTLHETPELPEQLTAGLEREYLMWFYTNQAYRKGAFYEAEIDEYVRAYLAPGAMSASFEWYRAFKTDIEQNQASSRTKLTMPVLALGGEKLTGHIMVPMAQVVADDVRGGSVPECGHWMAEEKPDYLLDQLNDFLPALTSSPVLVQRSPERVLLPKVAEQAWQYTGDRQLINLIEFGN